MMPPNPMFPPFGGITPITVKCLPLVAAQPIFGPKCRLLNIQLNNGAAGVDTVTLFDGQTSGGNDRLAIPVPANGSFSGTFTDIGIPFDNGITVTESGGNTTGYFLIAVDDT